MLKRIHSLTVGDNCFNDAFSWSEIQELLQFDVGNISSDDMLAKLTILHRMFRSLSRRSCCAKLIDICDYLVDNSVFTVLTPLMDVDYQHIVYMSAKAMASLVLYQPSMIKKSQLQDLFLDCLKFKWKPIYLMKMMTEVVNSLHVSSSKCLKSTVYCKCTRSHVDTGLNFIEYNPALYIELLIQDSKTVISSYVSLWKDIFENFLTTSNRDDTQYTNCSLEKIYGLHRNTSRVVQQKLSERCIEMSSRSEQILLSFLHFLSAFVNALQKHKIESQNTVMKNGKDLLTVIPLFAHLLQEQGLSSEVWKSIVELLSSCLSTDKNENQQFIVVLSRHISAAIITSTTIGVLDNIPVFNGFEGFGEENILPHNSSNRLPSVHHPGFLRQMSLLIIKASLVFMNGQHNDSLQPVIEVLNVWSSSLPTYNNSFVKMLLDMFADQDDELLQMMLVLLKLHISLVNSNQDNPDVQSTIKMFNPHVMFVGFLSTIHYDHSVLLDFLVSSETVFLEYLTCYLQLVLYDWEGFCHDIQGHLIIKEKTPNQSTTNDKPDNDSNVGLLSSLSTGDWNSLDDHDVLADHGNIDYDVSAIHDVGGDGDGVNDSVVTGDYDVDGDDVTGDYDVHVDDDVVDDTNGRIVTNNYDADGGGVTGDYEVDDDVTGDYDVHVDDDDVVVDDAYSNVITNNYYKDDDDITDDYDADDDDITNNYYKDDDDITDDYDADDDDITNNYYKDDDDITDDYDADDDDITNNYYKDDDDITDDYDADDDDITDDYDVDDDGIIVDDADDDDIANDFDVDDSSTINSADNININLDYAEDIDCSMLSFQSILEKTMSCLIHLRISVQRLVKASLFPYNVTPLLRKLKAVENRFDGC